MIKTIIMLIITIILQCEVNKQTIDRLYSVISSQTTPYLTLQCLAGSARGNQHNYIASLSVISSQQILIATTKEYRIVSFAKNYDFLNKHIYSGALYYMEFFKSFLVFSLVELKLNILSHKTEQRC